MPRRLGQHFLRPDSVEDLLRVISPAAGDVFLEIGPGTGALTLPLAERCARVVAVEIDEALARRLRATAPPNVEIVTHDALTADLQRLVPEGARLAGNLPYYVSSPLLRLFLGLHGHLRDLHVMLQEEVARRVASPPGSKEYGILSVLYALWTDTDIAARFPPGAFSPPPKVDSAVVRMQPLPLPPGPPPDLLPELVTVAFSQRRKLLRHTLGRWMAAEGIDAPFDLQRRAEEVPVAEYLALASAKPR